MGGWIAGLYIPRVINSGKLDFRFEFHHTGTRMYRHGQFESGWSLNRFLLGDDLGPDSRGVYIWVNADLTDVDLLTMQGAWEFRRDDTYVTNGLGERFNFFKTQEFAHEQRYRLQGKWMHRFKRWPLRSTIGTGYEYVQNFGYNADTHRHHFIGQVSLQLDFKGLLF